jgi:hypothetical protein
MFEKRNVFFVLLKPYFTFYFFLNFSYFISNPNLKLKIDQNDMVTNISFEILVIVNMNTNTKKFVDEFKSKI